MVFICTLSLFKLYLTCNTVYLCSEFCNGLSPGIVVNIQGMRESAAFSSALRS